MTPSEIRESLLREHAGLRALIAEVRRRMTKGADSAARTELSASMVTLAETLRVHNVREEGLLREILRDVDAWGPVRADVMDESHAHEHQDLVGALLAAQGIQDITAAGGTINDLLDRVESHMTREETVLLSEHVLRDDDLVIDYFGG